MKALLLTHAAMALAVLCLTGNVIAFILVVAFFGLLDLMTLL